MEMNKKKQKQKREENINHKLAHTSHNGKLISCIYISISILD